MACFNFILIVLFLFFLDTRGDTALITALCNKTRQPAVCTECLTSNSSGRTADFPELAIMIIGCAQFDAGVFRDDIQKLYDSAPDSITKTILDGCKMRAVNARYEFDAVIHGVIAEDFDGAKSIVNDQIIPAENYCLDEFNKKPTLVVPPRIIAGTVIVRQDCDMVVDFLSNIWYNNGARTIVL